MSAANSSAKKRRAPASLEPPKPAGPSMGPMNTPAGGMTLPQVISLIDKRLINLEAMTKTLSDKQDAYDAEAPLSSAGEATTPPDIQERFEVMADEIANLKNIVMSLQAYTMDVNRMLLEGRGVTKPMAESASSEVAEVPDTSSNSNVAADSSLPATAVTLDATAMMMGPEEESEDEYVAPITKVRWSSAS